MDESLLFIFPPASLTQLCTLKIAISMVKSELDNKSAKSFIHSHRTFEDIKTNLIKNFQRLKIPRKLASNLQNYLIFVLSEVRSWYPEIETICDLDSVETRFTKQLLRNITLTKSGVIDREETARKLVTSDGLSFGNRYRLACAFYLEDLVRRLWPRACKNLNFVKRSRRNKGKFEIVYWSKQMLAQPDSQTFKYIQDKLKEIMFWANPIKFLENYIDQFDGLHRQCVYIYAFAYALLSKQYYAARYFAKKCHDHHRLAILKSLTFNFGTRSRDFDFFNYSLMDRETVEGMFEINNEVYRMFSCLPSELFVSIFDYFKSFIDEDRFFNVLLAIAGHNMTLDDGYISPLDMNWNRVFKEIWLNQAPESYRTHVLNQTGGYDSTVACLVWKFYISNQIESVEILLEEQPESRRRALCADIIRNQWRLPQSSLNFLRHSSFKFLRWVFPQLVTSADDLQYLKGLGTTYFRSMMEWKEILVYLERSIVGSVLID